MGNLKIDLPIMMMMLLSMYSCLGQETEFIDQKIEQAKEEKKEAYRGLFFYKALSNETVLSRTDSPINTIGHLTPYLKDSVENVRSISYAMLARISDKSVTGYSQQDIKKKILIELLNGCLDEDKDIRHQNLTRLADLTAGYWSSNLAKLKKVHLKLEKIIKVYPDEFLNSGLIGVIGKFRINGVEGSLRELLTYSEVTEHELLEIHTNLARLGDTKSIEYLVRKIQNTDSFDIKYSLASELSVLIKGKQMTELVYTLYMDDSGLKPTEPLGRYIGPQPYQPSFIARYILNTPKLLIGNEFSDSENERFIKAKKLEKEKRDLEIIKINREWMNRTRGSWVYLQD